MAKATKKKTAAKAKVSAKKPVPKVAAVRSRTTAPRAVGALKAAPRVAATEDSSSGS